MEGSALSHGSREEKERVNFRKKNNTQTKPVQYSTVELMVPGPGKPVISIRINLLSSAVDRGFLRWLTWDVK